MESRNSSRLRTVDVARRAGCSVQQVRNLERAGVLPPATRTAAGYRVYDESHVSSALAYQALATGTGPVEAKRIMRAVHAYLNSDASARPRSGLFALLDAAHARLDEERRDLALAEDAARAIAAEPIADVLPSDAMSISELANALGIRPSALRHWDAAGLVVPRHRTTAREARRYSPDDVRDARIVHQLRLAGYRIPQLQALMPELRQAGRWEELISALATRHEGIEARSRALVRATAGISALLDQRT